MQAVLFTELPGEIPQGFSTPEFVVRPLRAADVELDYAAVMESRVELRPWEQTGWPADDFTVEDDLADLIDLEERQAQRRSFTYTVMTPDETQCLGCVYLMPPDAKSYTKADIEATDGSARWGDIGATVSFWVRTSRLGSGLDARLVESVREWIASAWPLARHVMMTNEQCAQQVALLERLGLRRTFILRRDDQAGAYVAYA